MPPELVNAILILLAIRAFTAERADRSEARPGHGVEAPAGAPRPPVESAAARAATTITKPKDRPRRSGRATGSRRRRRFSLPPMDDDHERVNRSIATFLSGGKSADSD